MSLFQSGSILAQIESTLTLLSERMKTFTGLGHNTDAKLLEPFAARLLNRLYGWSLTDPSQGNPNYKGLDLTDTTHSVAIQVSVQEPSGKIAHTIKMLTDEHRRTFTDIRCFFLLHHQFKKAPALPVITIRALLDELANKDPDYLRRFLSFLQSELTTLPDDNPTASERLVRLLHQHRAHPALSTLQPTFSRAVIPPAEFWEGRATELPDATARLHKHHRLAVTGPGGIGKTAFCARLVEQLPEPPAQILLHDFYTAPGLDSFIASVLHQAGLRIDDPDLQPAAAALVLATPGLLLYLEGAEKILSLTPLLQFLSSSTRLLLTTRRSDHLGTLTRFPLEPLSEPEAARLIHSHAAAIPRTSRQGEFPFPATSPGFTQLARDLGCLPLACRLAGRTCGVQTSDPADLHCELVEHGLQPLLSGDDSRENLELLFSRTAARLAATSTDEPAPSLIAWQLLTLGGTNPTPLSVLDALGLPSHAALRPLADYGIALSTSVPAEQQGEKETAWFLNHALLATWARNGLAPFGCTEESFLIPRVQWGMAAREKMIQSGAIPGGPGRYQIIAPLAENLLALVKNLPGLPPEILYRFFHFPARAHHIHASFLRAEALYREALAHMETTAGPTAPETATALNNLATLFQATNRLAEAEPLMRRALAINEESYGPSHPRVATDLNNLAQLLKDTNYLAEAEPLMRRALAIDEESYGPSHPKVAIRLNNHATLLEATNRLAEAEPLMRRALAIDEESYGPSHPNVAIPLNNLAMLLEATNRLAEAEPLMRRALAIDEENYGPSHPKVAIRLNNLAELLRATNRLVEAEPLMRRALTVDEASFGKDHPNVAIRLNNLATLLQDTDRLAEAEPLMRRHLEIFVDFTVQTGHPHTHLQAAIGNYAGLLEEMGGTEAEIGEKIVKLLEPLGRGV
jgi:tetratricopeptide (TPR) repeat protein